MGNKEIQQGSIVSKFGGSSSANGERVENVIKIINSNTARRFVVPSAPGKVYPEDRKVTELLITGDMPSVKDKFSEIGSHFSPKLWKTVNMLMDEVEGRVQEGANSEWIRSRGEWVMAQVYAQLLNAEFVDAKDIVRVNEDKSVNPETYDLVKERLNNKDKRYVIPGFYGATEKGLVLCFDRGGSDISGAVIARGIGARLYENWTDVDGVKAADPKLVRNPNTIREITYREMRELAYRGAEVLQMDAVLPVLDTGIPINIRNTFRPDREGTYIMQSRAMVEGETVIGIAGGKGFVSFQIEKYGMNREKGIVRKVLEVFEDNNVSFEHDPTGIDSMSIVLRGDQLDRKSIKIQNDLNKIVHPDSIQIVENIGLICLVGQGISGNATQVQRKVFSTFDRLGISLTGESYSIVGNNIILAVDERFMDYTIRQLYKTFII